MKKEKKKRKMKAEKSCGSCDAICCRYVAIPIDPPTTPRDFEDVRGYIAHRDVWVVVEDGDWYVCVDRNCRYLGRDNKCTIYEKRPSICRTYKTADCEHHGSGTPYDFKFSDPEELQEYAKEYFRQKRARARAKARRLGLRR